MISVEKSIVVKRAISEVFDYVTTPHNIPEWQSSALAAKLEPEGVPQVGSTMFIKRKMMGRKLDNYHEITLFEPPNRMCYTPSKGRMEAVGCMQFEAEGSGTTATITFEGEPRGIMRLVSGFLGRQISSGIEGDLARLKALLEAAGSEA